MNEFVEAAKKKDAEKKELRDKMRDEAMKCVDEYKKENGNKSFISLRIRDGYIGKELGGENDGIYFRGVRVKVNKAPNNIDFSPYSIVYLKEIKVQYDLNLTPEQFEQRKAMKEEWGISDEEELIREKTIARIDKKKKNKEQEKSKMFKEEVSE